MPLVRVADPRRGVLLPPGYLARRRAAFQNVNAMLARGRGLGAALVSGIPDSATCGANPCTLFDTIGPSAACLAFVQCADPTDFSSWLAGKGGLVPSLAAQAGSDVSSTVNQTADALFGGLLGENNPPNTSGVNWVIVGGLLLAVLFVPRLLKA